MQASIETSADGRHIIKITFQRQGPDSFCPWIEAVYHLYWPEDFSLSGEPFALLPLSCTRVDTRESAQLTLEETNAVLEKAVVQVKIKSQEW